MSDCANCSGVSPIEDTGTVLLDPREPFIAEKVRHVDSVGRLGVEWDGSRFQARYTSKEQLLHMLGLLFETLSAEERQTLHMAIRSDFRPQPAAPYVPVQQFMARMHNYDLVRIIQDGRFTSHMQPIVSTGGQTVFGYEFVLRPAEDIPPFKPFELFQVAQQTGLHSFLDRSARISAIQTSAVHLPRGVKRFVNFLPSSIYNPNYCLSHTFGAIDRLAQDPADFVFEVVETERIEDVGHLQNIFAVYKRHGMKVALDDVGAGFNTLDTLARLEPDYVKIDRGLIDRCDADAGKQKAILDIVRLSESIGATVLAEGLERPEEWDFCKEAGIPLAQGYLLGKPAPAPLESETVALPR